MSTKEFSIQQIILGSHLWLGISACIFTWGTFVLIHQPVSLGYLVFVLVGTMTIYNIHSFFSVKEKRKHSNDVKIAIPGYLTGTIMAGSITTLIVYLYLDRSEQLILLLPACMAISYVFPVYHGKRLKDYPYIKIIAIMIAWTTVTFWIPVHSIDHWWEEIGYNYLLVDRLLFFFALAIPFDIRDIQLDRTQRLKTIPNTIGLNNSQFLAIFLLFLAGIFLSMGSEVLNIDPGIKYGVFVIYVLLGIFIIRLKYLPTPRFYSLFIDGILLLYGIVVLFLSR